MPKSTVWALLGFENMDLGGHLVTSYAIYLGPEVQKSQGDRERICTRSSVAFKASEIGSTTLNRI